MISDLEALIPLVIVVVLLSLFWKKITKTGALSGLIVGGVTVIVWNKLPASLCPIFGIYETLPAFILR